MTRSLCNLVDVRDMLCAQALARVAKALEPLAFGEALDVRYNADDVREDLLVWARGFGHAVSVIGASTLRLIKIR
jgi:TusA-related sulfurtransferase